MAEKVGEYPVGRPRYFAHKFCRVMAKSCLANELGVDACWLLTVIAHTEDAGGYRKAISYHNGQLAAFCGFGSEDKLIRVRKKVVDAGWLHYAPGARGKAARYWVTIPDAFLGMDDHPSDERPEKYGASDSPQSESQCPTVASESAVNVRVNVLRPEQTESQYPEFATESAENPPSIRGQCASESTVNVRDSSSLDLDPNRNLDRQTPKPPKSPSVVPSNTVPFDPLRAEQEARKLFESRWNAAGLRKFSRLTHTLHGRLAALLLDPWWAENYPAALVKAGTIPFLATGVGRQKGPLNVGEFLRSDDEVRRILDGDYDPRPATTQTGPVKDRKQAEMDAVLAEYNANEVKRKAG